MQRDKQTNVLPKLRWQHLVQEQKELGMATNTKLLFKYLNHHWPPPTQLQQTIFTGITNCHRYGTSVSQLCCVHSDPQQEVLVVMYGVFLYNSAGYNNSSCKQQFYFLSAYVIFIIEYLNTITT